MAQGLRIKVNRTTSGWWWVRSDPPAPEGYHMYVVTPTWGEAMDLVRQCLKAERGQRVPQ